MCSSNEKLLHFLGNVFILLLSNVFSIECVSWIKIKLILTLKIMQFNLFKN